MSASGLLPGKNPLIKDAVTYALLKKAGGSVRLTAKELIDAGNFLGLGIVRDPETNDWTLTLFES